MREPEGLLNFEHFFMYEYQNMSRVPACVHKGIRAFRLKIQQSWGFLGPEDDKRMMLVTPSKMHADYLRRFRYFPYLVALADSFQRLTRGVPKTSSEDDQSKYDKFSDLAPFFSKSPIKGRSAPFGVEDFPVAIQQKILAIVGTSTSLQSRHDQLARLSLPTHTRIPLDSNFTYCEYGSSTPRKKREYHCDDYVTEAYGPLKKYKLSHTRNDTGIEGNETVMCCSHEEPSDS